MRAPTSPIERAGALRTALTDLERAKSRLLAPAATAANLKLAALTNSKAPRAQRLGALVRTLGTAAAALRNPPPVTPETFVVHVSVVDETGAPREDCSLVVADAGQLIAAKIGPQKTNADGYATVTLRAAEFPTIVGGGEAVFASVLDPAGRQVFAPDTAIAAKAGLAVVFRAVVPRTVRSKVG